MVHCLGFDKLVLEENQFENNRIKLSKWAMNIIDDLKLQYKVGGVARIIYWNIGCFSH
jgi:hypothetical protein